MAVESVRFKSGGVSGCAEILARIEAGKVDTGPPITDCYKLENIKEDGFLLVLLGCPYITDLQRIRLRMQANEKMPKLLGDS